MMNQLIITNDLDELVNEALSLIASNPDVFCWDIVNYSVKNIITHDRYYLRTKQHIIASFRLYEGLILSSIIYKDGVDLPFNVLEYLQSRIARSGDEAPL